MTIDDPLRNIVSRIVAYEEDRLSQAEEIELFQELVNNGMAWRLQGHYGRTAAHLIAAGLIMAGPEMIPQPVGED